MTSPSEFERYAIIRLNGHDKPPADAVAHGSWSDVSQHIPSSTVLREKLQIINDAAITEFRLNHRLDDICRREDVLTKAEAKLKADHAGFNHNLADELYRRVTDLEVRLAQLESKRAHDPDDDELPSPPGDPGALPLHDPNPPPGTPDVAQMLPDGISDEVETDTRGQFLRIPVGKLRMHDGEEFPDPELPHPPVQQQPIAAGLDDGD